MATLESAAGVSNRRMLNGIAWLGGIELAYNVYGGTNSSPQTTDVFGGGKRSETLMLWVSIAGAKCFAFGLIAGVIMRSWWPFLGLVTGFAAMHPLYLLANRRAKERAEREGEVAAMQEQGNTRGSSSRSSYRARA